MGVDARAPGRLTNRRLARGVLIVGVVAAWVPAVFVLAASLRIDLGWIGVIADLGSAGLVLGILIAMVMLVCRRFVFAGAAGIAVLLGLATLVGGRPVTGAQLVPPRAGASVWVTTANLQASNEADLRSLGLTGSVVVLIEPSPEQSLETRDGWVRERWPWREVCPPVLGESSRVIVLSSFPMRLAPRGGESNPSAGILGVLIETSLGEVGVVAFHAPSPRSPSDDARGKVRTRSAAKLAQAMESTEGVIWVALAGDLNGTPTGYRSRVLEAAGFRRSKPVLKGGTWPAGWPGIARLAIDDVFAGSGVEMLNWRTVPLAGSDHLGVTAQVIYRP